MQKCNKSKHLETYEHKIRMLYPDGFVFQKGSNIYQVMFKDITEEEVEQLKTKHDIYSICSYSDFMTYRREGKINKNISPGCEGITIDDILKDCKILF